MAARLAEGTPIVVDGTTGVIHVDPDVSLLAELTAARDGRAAALREAQDSALQPARTIDGTTIEVAANIGSPADAVRAVAAGADGVGLFRTEFLFMSKSSMPDARERQGRRRARLGSLHRRLDGFRRGVCTRPAHARRPSRTRSWPAK